MMVDTKLHVDNLQNFPRGRTDFFRFEVRAYEPLSLERNDCDAIIEPDRNFNCYGRLFIAPLLS
jgi:hypothetical protein